MHWYALFFSLKEDPRLGIIQPFVKIMHFLNLPLTKTTASIPPKRSVFDISWSWVSSNTQGSPCSYHLFYDCIIPPRSKWICTIRGVCQFSTKYCHCKMKKRHHPHQYIVDLAYRKVSCLVTSNSYPCLVTHVRWRSRCQDNGMSFWLYEFTFTVTVSPQRQLF